MTKFAFVTVGSTKFDELIEYVFWP